MENGTLEQANVRNTSAGNKFKKSPAVSLRSIDSGISLESAAGRHLVVYPIDIDNGSDSAPRQEKKRFFGGNKCMF